MVVGTCWIWPNTRKDGYGYVNFWENGRRFQRRTHRVSVELDAGMEVGSIPSDVDVGHLCHDEDPACVGGPTCLHRACFRPDHLKIMSREENLSVLRRSVCPHGHQRRPGKNCPGCNKEALRSLYAKRKAAGLSVTGKPYTRGPYKVRKTG